VGLVQHLLHLLALGNVSHHGYETGELLRGVQDGRRVRQVDPGDAVSVANLDFLPDAGAAFLISVGRFMRQKPQDFFPDCITEFARPLPSDSFPGQSQDLFTEMAVAFQEASLGVLAGNGARRALEEIKERGLAGILWGAPITEFSHHPAP